MDITKTILRKIFGEWIENMVYFLGIFFWSRQDCYAKIETQRDCIKFEKGGFKLEHVSRTTGIYR